jgi:hypothetical protein
MFCLAIQGVLPQKACMSDPLKGHLDAARSSVLLIPAPDHATLVVTGKDRLTWLNGMITCDLSKAGPGKGVYGLAVGKNGRCLTDLIVVVKGDRVELVVPQAVRDELKASLEHYLIMEDAELSHGNDDVYFAHGPRATELPGAVAVDRTGLGGAVILGGYRPAHEDAARALGGQVGDQASWEALRLELGVPRFGADFDKTTYPQEAGLEKTAVSFDKGCYLGQEVVCMLEMRGHVKRKLVPLIIEGELPRRGAKVSTAEGEEVGEITSAALSPTLAKPVALAMVKRAHTAAGTALKIGEAGAKVVARPV